MKFSGYLILGDSIISDCYPGPGLGASSLLLRNHDEKFPAFRGRDLQHCFPGLWQRGVARTGYQIPDLQKALQASGSSSQPTLVIVSVGGNDLMVDWENLNSAWFTGLGSRYRELQREISRRYPQSLRLACNVYDPTDGTGLVASAVDRGQAARPQLIQALGDLNRTLADNLEGAQLVELHDHFLGHGVLSKEKRLPGWFQRDIEPNVEGASQVRAQLWERIPR